MSFVYLSIAPHDPVAVDLFSRTQGRKDHEIVPLYLESLPEGWHSAMDLEKHPEKIEENPLESEMQGSSPEQKDNEQDKIHLASVGKLAFDQSFHPPFKA